MTKKRSMKVYGQSGYKYQETPTIMLKGMWLREAGFEIGDYISITCEDGRLVITQDVKREEREKAEAAMLGKEMKNFQKKLKDEKKNAHLQHVAEKRAGYGK